MSARCSRCAFSSPNLQGSQPGSLLCRAGPPTPQALLIPQTGQATVLSCWPVVSASDWCGAYEPDIEGAAALAKSSGN